MGMPIVMGRGDRLRKSTGIKTRYLVYIRDRWTCQLCGRFFPPDENGWPMAVDGRSLQVDHLVPKNRGGAKNDYDNEWCLCSWCHLWKTNEFDRRPFEGPVSRNGKQFDEDPGAWSVAVPTLPEVALG